MRGSAITRGDAPTVGSPRITVSPDGRLGMLRAEQYAVDPGRTSQVVSALLSSSREAHRLLARGTTRLRAPAGYIGVLTPRVEVITARRGMEIARALPSEGSLTGLVVSAREAVAIPAFGADIDPLVAARAQELGVRALIGAPIGHAEGALILVDRRPRDIEPAALDYVSRLAQRLDAIIESLGAP